jgi:predicted molibdopterin-dependent oxidoreductase YjgC
MEYRNTLTTCVYCGCGCGIYVETVDGQITGAWPPKTHPVSQGKLCIKGWNVTDFVEHPDRLKMPMIRNAASGELVEATWDEAISLIAETLGEIKTKSGPDSIGFLTSAKCTNEENYLLQKFARAVIGTNNVDHCARL